MSENVCPWDKDGNVFVIGEIGVNHNGELEKALKLIDVAAEAGANAVKFQTFDAERLVTSSAPKAEYQNRQDPTSASQIEMLRRLELSADQYREINQYASQKSIMFMSTPFDEQSADFLVDLGVSVFKVSSGDLTHLNFLQHLANKSLPMIISTGMANLSEVEDAVEAIKQAGDPPLAILHCVSNYPASPHEANLLAINTISQAFGKAVGWSDHMEGSAISLAAVARGARIVEKHYTLDRQLPGPDHAASLEPREFIQYVKDIRIVESALGDGIKRPSADELKVSKVARRSITTSHPIPKGSPLSADVICYKRPGDGIPPKRLPEVIGRKVTRDIPAGTTLKWDDLGAF